MAIDLSIWFNQGHRIDLRWWAEQLAWRYSFTWITLLNLIYLCFGYSRSRLWFYDQRVTTKVRYFQPSATEIEYFQTAAAKMDIFRRPQTKFGISKLCGPRQCVRVRRVSRKVNCSDRRIISRPGRKISRGGQKISRNGRKCSRGGRRISRGLVKNYSRLSKISHGMVRL